MENGMEPRLSRRTLLGMGLSAAGVGAVLAACGSAEFKAPGTSTADGSATKTSDAEGGGEQSGSVTIRFMRFAGAGWEHDVTFTDKFMEEHPNIAIKGEDIVYSEMFKKCLALGATESLADVFAGHNRWTPYLAYKGLMLDLDPLIETNKEAVEFDDFYPSVIADARGIGTEGKLYWFPTVVHPAGNGVVMFNMDLMNKAGVEPPQSKDWTIADYEEIVRAVADPTNGIFGGDIIINNGPHYATQFTRTWGSNPVEGAEDAWLVSKDGKTQQLDSPPVKEALEWYWQLIDDGLVPTSGQKSALEETGVTHFTAGQMVTQATTVGGPASATQKVNGKFEIHAVLWPKGPHGHRGSCLSYNTQSVWAKTEHPEEAFKFLSYMTGPEIAFYTGYEGTLHCMARRSAWSNPKLWEKFPVMEDAADWFEQGVDPYPQPWNLRAQEHLDVWREETTAYFDGKENWDEMYAHAQQRCQEVLDLSRP